MAEIKEYAETHQKGYLSVDMSIKPELLKKCDVGVMISRDGRIWICVDGLSFIRFRPALSEKE